MPPQLIVTKLTTLLTAMRIPRRFDKPASVNGNQAAQQDAADLLYQHGTGGLFISLASSSGLALMSLQQLPRGPVYLWWTVMTVVLALRAIDLAWYRSHKSTSKASGSAHVFRFGLGVLTAGAVWASFAIAFFGDLDPAGRAYTAVILSAMVGGSATVLAPSQPLSLIYCACLLLPASSRFIALGGAENIILGILGCLFYIVMSASARLSHKVLMNSIRLSRANELLAAETSREREKTENANLELQAAQEALHDANRSLESRIAARTVELEWEVRAKEHYLKELACLAEEYQQLADSVPQMVWRMKESGKLDYANQGWTQFSGLTLDGAELSWHSLLHPEDRDEFLRQWQESIREGTRWAAECRMRQHSNSPYRWFLFQAVPTADRPSGVQKWYATFTDIDHQKRIERALQTANEELSQFAYAAAHDLREPLRNVALTLGLLREEQSLNEQATQWVTESEENARRMHAMVRDLLTYSKAVEAADGIVPIHDANDSLRQALANLSSSIRENQAEVTSDVLPTLRVRPTHLIQLFQNLIQNSIKYRKRDMAPLVQITASAHGAEWLFSVTDNGIGFDPAYATRIFGLFKRLHRNDEYPGTGIGLAICSRIVSHYGGRIWAEGNLGEGAVFRFTFPAA